MAASLPWQPPATASTATPAMIVNERRILGSSHPLPLGGKWAATVRPLSAPKPAVGFQAGRIDRWHRNGENWWIAEGQLSSGSKPRLPLLPPKAVSSIYLLGSKVDIIMSTRAGYWNHLRAEISKAKAADTIDARDFHIERAGEYAELLAGSDAPEGIEHWKSAEYLEQGLIDADVAVDWKIPL